MTKRPLNRLEVRESDAGADLGVERLELAHVPLLRHRKSRLHSILESPKYSIYGSWTCVSLNFRLESNCGVQGYLALDSAFSLFVSSLELSDTQVYEP